MGDMESCWALSAPPECRTSKDLAQVSWLMLFFRALCIEAALVVFSQKCSLVIILKLQGEDWVYFMLLLFFPKVIFQFGKKKRSHFFPAVWNTAAHILLVPSKHKPSWVKRCLLVTASKRRNLWGWSLYPTCALLEHLRSHPTHVQKQGTSW